jgi:DNA-binding transcriptional LysR family regulator
MERMSIIGMNAFAQVVEGGSFVAAAGRLKVSPATITHHVNALEGYLGVRLLTRTTRTVSLTEAGATFYDRCRNILAEIEEAENATTALQAAPRGILRINTSAVLARLVTPVIVDYAAIYPDVSFELVMTDRPVDIAGEKYDLALRTDRLSGTTLMTRGIGLGRLVLCASPKYIERSGTPNVPSDLVHHNCMTYVNAMVGPRWHFTRNKSEEFVDVSGNLRTNSIEGMRAAALAGNGICLLPTFSIVEDFRQGRLVPLLTDFFAYEATIHAIYPAGRHMSPKVRTFLDFVAAAWGQREKVQKLFPAIQEI